MRTAILRLPLPINTAALAKRHAAKNRTRDRNQLTGQLPVDSLWTKNYERSIDRYIDATRACKCFARQRTCVANGNAALPQQPADTGQLAAYSLHPSEIRRIQFSCQVRRIIEQIGGEPQRLLLSGSPGWKSIMPRPGKEAPPVNKASHQRGKPSRPFGKLLYSLTVKTLTV